MCTSTGPSSPGSGLTKQCCSLSPSLTLRFTLGPRLSSFSPKGGGWVGCGGLGGNGRDLTAPRAGHLSETAGHGRAMAAVGADAVARAPAHGQVDGVVGTFDEGPAVRA